MLQPTKPRGQGWIAPILKVQEILLETYPQVTSLFSDLAILLSVVMPESLGSIAANLLLILHLILPVSTSRNACIAVYL